MNMNDFIALTNDQQLNTTQTKGVLLASRRDPSHRITLYKVDSFYVELYFNLREMRITMLSAIHSDYIHELYFDEELIESPQKAAKEDYNHLSTVIRFPPSFYSSLS